MSPYSYLTSAHTRLTTAPFTFLLVGGVILTVRETQIPSAGLTRSTGCRRHADRASGML